MIPLTMDVNKGEGSGVLSISNYFLESISTEDEDDQVILTLLQKLHSRK